MIEPSDVDCDSARISGDALAEIMRQCGLTKEQLAEALEVSTPTVHNWCTGRTGMRMKHFAKLLSLLAAKGCPADKFQALVLNAFTQHGLSLEAAHQLIPAPGSVPQSLVLFVASEALETGNRLTIIGARDYLRHMGLDVLVVSASSEKQPVDMTPAELIINGNLKGVMISRPRDTGWTRAVIEAARRRGIPVVALHDRHELGRELNLFVGPDQVDVGRTAANYLLGIGHRKLGVLGASSGLRRDIDRLRGFREVAAENQAPVPDQFVFWAMNNRKETESFLPADQPRLNETAARALEYFETGKITGLFCSSRVAASALLSVANSLNQGCAGRTLDIVNVTIDTGLNIGMNVVGDPRPAWEFSGSNLRIAQVVLPHYEIGRQAARLLTLPAVKSFSDEIRHEIIVPHRIRSPQQLSVKRYMTYAS